MPRLIPEIPHGAVAPAVAADTSGGGAAAFPEALASLRAAADRPHQDAALLAACDGFDRADSLVVAQNLDDSLVGVPAGDPRHGIFWREVERAGADWNDAVDAVRRHPATTAEGVRAKAEAARRILLRDTCMQTGDGEDDGDFADYATRGQWAILSLLDDLTGRAAR